jgi:hypothetical protein
VDAGQDSFSLEGLDPKAEQARDRLATHLARTDQLANRFEAKRAATTANEHSAASWTSLTQTAFDP